MAPGREKLTALISVGAFRAGVAGVVVLDPAHFDYEHRQFALIDTTGAYRLPPRATPLTGPDAAGLLRALVTTPNPDGTPRPGVQFLRPSGAVAFAGVFDEAGPFWHGRALVRVGPRCGVIDTLGRYVFPLLTARPLDTERPTRVGSLADGAALAAGQLDGIPNGFGFTGWYENGPFVAFPAPPPADSLPGAEVWWTTTGFFGFDQGHPRLVNRLEDVLDLPDLPPGTPTGPAPVANFFTVRRHMCLDTTGLPRAPWRSAAVCPDVRRQVPYSGVHHGYILSGSSDFDADEAGYQQHFAVRTATEWLVFDLTGRLHYRAALPDSLLRRPPPRPGESLSHKPAPAPITLQLRFRNDDATYRLEDPAGRPVSRGLYCTANYLADDWFAAMPADTLASTGCQGVFYNPTVLISPDGREIAAPPGASWPYGISGQPYPDAGALPPFRRGVVLTSKGYLTKGGRQLWRDE